MELMELRMRRSSAPATVWMPKVPHLALPASPLRTAWRPKAPTWSAPEAAAIGVIHAEVFQMLDADGEGRIGLGELTRILGLDHGEAIAKLKMARDRWRGLTAEEFSKAFAEDKRVDAFYQEAFHAGVLAQSATTAAATPRAAKPRAAEPHATKPFAAEPWATEPRAPEDDDQLAAATRSTRPRRKRGGKRIRAAAERAMNNAAASLAATCPSYESAQAPRAAAQVPHCPRSFNAALALARAERPAAQRGWLAVLPPDGTPWEWPLSRQEKTMRLVCIQQCEIEELHARAAGGDECDDDEEDGAYSDDGFGLW